MPVDEARRPLRIIEASVRPDAAVLPLLRQADRFQRVLLRPEKSAPRAERAPSQDTPRAAQQQPPAQAQPHEAAASSPPAVRAAEPQHQNVESPSSAAAAGVGLAGPQPDSALAPVAWADERDAEGGGEDAAWQAELAHMIALLCNSADPGLEGWSVSLPMNARVLPQTTLRLELSPHWLALRFSTESPHSLRLLSGQRSSLAALLAQLLERDQSIDIEIT